MCASFFFSPVDKQHPDNLAPGNEKKKNRFGMRRDERGQTVPERLGRVRDKRVNRAKNALRKPAGRSAKVRAARAAAEKGVMKDHLDGGLLWYAAAECRRMDEMREAEKQESR